METFWAYSTIFWSLLTIIVHAGQTQEQALQTTPRRQTVICALRIDKSIQLAPETLAYYASQNTLDAFRATLQQHPEQLNSLDNRGLTPLQEAICAGSNDIVCHICTTDLNINIEQYSSTGCTALHYATEYASLCSCKETRICNRCRILNLILNYYHRNGIKDRNPVRRSRYRIRYYIPFIYKPLDEWLTPLHIAALRGGKKQVQILLENGADANKLTYGQISPLHYAAYYCGNGLDYYEIASLLCRNRAQLDQEDRYYTTPLAMAIRSQTTEHDTEKSATAKEKMITYLLQQGADANHRDMLGTPLTQSVKKSSPEGIILALLDAYADIQATDRDGRTALDWTIIGDKPQEKVQRILMRQNARITLSRTELQNKGTQANWVLFPVHEAADSGDLTRVKSLLQSKKISHLIGLDANGKYPLHYAVRGNHQEIVHYLLINSFDRSHNSADIATHPIADAIELGLYDMVEILLDRLPENYFTNHGEQLLDYIKICKQKNQKILEMEKAGTITIDSVQYSIDTLADWYDAIARLLVTRGATKRNLFKWAIVNKLPLLTAYLVEQNPEVLKDSTEPELTIGTHIIRTDQPDLDPARFPLHIATYNGNLIEIKSILEQLPQEKYIQHLREQDNNGQSPLDYAIRNGHEHIINYILTLCRPLDIIDELRTQVITTAIEYGLYRIIEISLREAPAEYLAQRGEQLLNYIVACNRTLPNAEKKDSITIDDTQYTMNTLIDCRDAIALLLVKHGAAKNNLLKWATFNKLSRLATYQPKILKSKPYVQDALQLAINSQDPVMMELLITHGALRGENNTYLGIIQKLVDQQGLKDVYLSLVDPGTIARSLHGTNPQDNVTRSLVIDRTHLNIINLRGTVEPVLSSDLGKENYSGYYALYNAICWAQGYGHTGQLNPISIKRREAFIPFFESMLTFLHEHINPPYDKLTLEHIDLLIQYIRNSSAQVSQETLKNIALIDLSDVELVMQEVLARKANRTQAKQPSKLSQKRRELYNRYAGVFDRFTDRTRSDKTDNIAVIVTSKNYPSMWFTVCFKRNSDSSVTFQIYDSINPIELWEQDSLYRMCSSGIIQLWYMATHTRNQWQEIFTPEIQKSIKAIRSRIEARNPKKPVAEFLRDLDIFTDALGGLQESAKDYQISTTQGKEFAFIHTLRYARFYQEYEIFYYTLLSLRDSKTISDPTAQKADEFIEKHMSIGEIEKALTLLAHEQYASLEERNKAWHTVIAKIQSTIQEALTIRMALSQ